MKKETMEVKWMLEDIDRMKKFIDENNGSVNLMINVTRTLLPLLEDDKEIEISRQDGPNNGHLYINHGENINGKYHINMIYIY